MCENTASSTPAAYLSLLILFNLPIFCKVHVCSIIRTCVDRGILLQRKFKDQIDKKTKNTYRKIWGIRKRVERLQFYKALVCFARAVNIFGS